MSTTTTSMSVPHQHKLDHIDVTRTLFTKSLFFTISQTITSISTNCDSTYRLYKYYVSPYIGLSISPSSENETVVNGSRYNPLIFVTGSTSTTSITYSTVSTFSEL